MSCLYSAAHSHLQCSPKQKADPLHFDFALDASFVPFNSSQKMLMDCYSWSHGCFQSHRGSISCAIHLADVSRRSQAVERYLVIGEDRSQTSFTSLHLSLLSFDMAPQLPNVGIVAA